MTRRFPLLPKMSWLLALVALGASCSSSTPAADLGVAFPEAPSATPSVTTSTTFSPPIVLDGSAKVDKEVVVDPPQRGFAAPVWTSEGYRAAEWRASLERMTATGADWVTLVVTWYQDGPASVHIAPEVGGRTASDMSIIDAIESAHTLGLHVALKLHVDLLDGSARSTISPADQATWFTNYQAYLEHYAGLASANNADMLVVGTELAGVSDNTEAWRSLIHMTRRSYPGPVTYASNFDEVESVEFWDAVDFIGVNAYWPLSRTPTSDVGELVEAWQPVIDQLEKISVRWSRPILLTEAGYTSQVGTVTSPHDPYVSRVQSLEEQAAAVEALLTAFSAESWFAGVHWWMWFGYPGPDQTQELAIGYTPRDKPAEAVIAAHWQQGRE